MRFVSGLGGPLKVVVNNAAHELLHPPYDLAHDKELRETIASLKGDAFLMDHVTRHNPSFGYSVMQQERYVGSHGPFRDFLVGMVRSGKLAAGRIGPLHAAFFGGRTQLRQ